MNYRKIKVKETKNDRSILDRLLSLKDLTDEEKEKFLNPSKKDFLSPYLFSDMEKAKERIFKAIENNEKILVWGDFDCDGVTSSTVLYKALKELGANVIKFIPDRLLHGHGLNSKELVKLIATQKVKLVITVDCGISNITEVNLLNGLKVDIIITDHHTTDIELPKAYAIINPQVKGAIKSDVKIEDITSLTYNSGSIVAYKLAMALLEDNSNNDLKDELLVIASCGAVADVVPLLGENRSIVNEGIKLLNEKTFKSSKAIYTLLSKNIKDRQITSTDIAFILAPRINAVGRLSNAQLSFDFLNEDNDEKLDIIVQKLDNFNAIRQAKCAKTYDDAIEYLKNNKEELNYPATILINPNWHVGIIGIVAARLVEDFNKPCFLMTVDENNNARCSIRSNDKINVYNVLKENQELFLGFGGHKLAGGCSFLLDTTKFEDVKKALLKTIEETKNDTIDDNSLYCDIELNTDDINLDLIETINKFEPFGQENEPPLCAMFDVYLDEFKTMGKENNHLRFSFSKDNKKFTGMKWQENSLEIPFDTKCDIAFYPRLNVFNDTKSVQFEIVDIFAPCVENKNKKRTLKIYDHRKKTGIFEGICDYLKNDNLDIVIWAKTPATKEKLSKYENIKNHILNDNDIHNGLMFFDYPSNIDEMEEIISSIKPKKIHFMNSSINENLEDYIKQINGMIKYCANKLDGNLDLTRMSQALGVSINFIQLTLEILENLDSVEILDIDKIKYLKTFSFEDFKNNSLFELLQNEFRLIIEFKKNILNCELAEIEEKCQEFCASKM